MFHQARAINQERGEWFIETGVTIPGRCKEDSQHHGEERFPGYMLHAGNQPNFGGNLFKNTKVLMSLGVFTQLVKSLRINYDKSSYIAQ